MSQSGDWLFYVIGELENGVWRNFSEFGGINIKVGGIQPWFGGITKKYGGIPTQLGGIHTPFPKNPILFQAKLCFLS
ncbi:hypothetical protein [Neobacillus drentensis]|uniref:hypothetical protein n=1 Tax=Neobacillus drentensis TaxID=220684 RepID=UPI000824A388|nr:hypothetical protein [Neobacillus drentensis]